MSQSIIPSEVNKGVCAAVGCFAEATTEIKVKIRKQGTIWLLLCKECVNRLDGKARHLVLNYIFCDRRIWNGFPDEVIYFKAEDTRSDTNKIINWTLFDDPRLTQNRIHKVRTKG